MLLARGGLERQLQLVHRDVLAFKFKNNQRNLQILLPLTVTINEFAWGWSFLLALGLAATAYVGGGVVFGQRSGHPQRGLAAHPHCVWWQEGVALARDGAQFISSRGAGSGRRREGYERVAAKQKEPKAEKKKGKGKKDKSSEKERGGKEKDGKAASGKRRGSDRREAAPAPAPAPAPAAAPSAAAGTAAGDGGRWVHVPG